MRLKRKKVKSGSLGAEGQTFSLQSLKDLPCKECGKIVKNCCNTTSQVTCPMCVQKHIDPPLSIIRLQNKEEKIKRPRGWAFMAEFVDEVGNVFFKGKEQIKLKGTLPATKIEITERKVRLTKRQKSENENAKNELYAEIQQIKDSWVTNNVPTRMRRKDERIIKSIEKKIKKMK